MPKLVISRLLLDLGFLNLNSRFIKQKIDSLLKERKIGNHAEENCNMKLDLNRRELQLIKLWWLSCEDMMIPEGTCQQCELKAECEVVRKKLYGKNGGIRSRGSPNNQAAATIPNTEMEEFIPT